MSADVATNSHATLDWAQAAAPMPSETLLGDRAVVVFDDRGVLLAAIDGLGQRPRGRRRRAGRGIHARALG